MATLGAGFAAARPAGHPREFLGRPHEPVSSLYIHVPFCFHKCHYCDFYSLVDREDRQERFTAALVAELETLSRVAAGGARPTLETVFVGGGTPSLLRVELWRRLLAALGERFDFAAAGFEFTVECNPETVSPELMAEFVEGGVTRVSIGAQSFDARHLKTLERWHDPANVARALAMAAEAGIHRRSIDLIYGTPGQTLEEWGEDLERALSLDPGVEHLSCYALTYEPNTPMTVRLRRGEFERCEEGLEADMSDLAVERLARAGLRRYEVSNFARPGAESRHNLVYWRQGSWLAAGPSASGHLRVGEAGGWRWKNVPRISEWMEGVEGSGWSPVVDVEAPEAARALRERLMMGLRITEGIDETELRARAGENAPGLSRAIDAEVAGGLLARADGRIAPTARGMDFADGVARRLMRALSSA